MEQLRLGGLHEPQPVELVGVRVPGVGQLHGKGIVGQVAVGLGRGAGKHGFRNRAVRAGVNDPGRRREGGAVREIDVLHRAGNAVVRGIGAGRRAPAVFSVGYVGVLVQQDDGRLAVKVLQPRLHVQRVRLSLGGDRQAGVVVRGRTGQRVPLQALVGGDRLRREKIGIVAPKPCGGKEAAVPLVDQHHGAVVVRDRHAVDDRQAEQRRLLVAEDLLVGQGARGEIVGIGRAVHPCRAGRSEGADVEGDRTGHARLHFVGEGIARLQLAREFHVGHRALGAAPDDPLHADRIRDRDGDLRLGDAVFRAVADAAETDHGFGLRAGPVVDGAGLRGGLVALDIGRLDLDIGPRHGFIGVSRLAENVGERVAPVVPVVGAQELDVQIHPRRADRHRDVLPTGIAGIDRGRLRPVGGVGGDLVAFPVDHLRVGINHPQIVVDARSGVALHAEQDVRGSAARVGDLNGHCKHVGIQGVVHGGADRNDRRDCVDPLLMGDQRNVRVREQIERRVAELCQVADGRHLEVITVQLHAVRDGQRLILDHGEIALRRVHVDGLAVDPMDPAGLQGDGRSVLRDVQRRGGCDSVAAAVLQACAPVVVPGRVQLLAENQLHVDLVSRLQEQLVRLDLVGVEAAGGLLRAEVGGPDDGLVDEGRQNVIMRLGVALKAGDVEPLKGVARKIRHDAAAGRTGDDGISAVVDQAQGKVLGGGVPAGLLGGGDPVHVELVRQRFSALAAARVEAEGHGFSLEAHKIGLDPAVGIRGTVGLVHEAQPQLEAVIGPGVVREADILVELQHDVQGIAVLDVGVTVYGLSVLFEPDAVQERRGVVAQTHLRVRDARALGAGQGDVQNGVLPGEVVKLDAIRACAVGRSHIGLDFQPLADHGGIVVRIGMGYPHPVSIAVGDRPALGIEQHLILYHFGDPVVAQGDGAGSPVFDCAGGADREFTALLLNKGASADL